MKPILSATIGCLLSLGLVGCGGGAGTSGDENAANPSAAQQDSSAQALASDPSATPSVAPAAASASYPGGSWTCSCPDRTVNYGSDGRPAQIIAYCYDRSHKLVRNGVWVWSCSTGCFWNNNGKLTCGSCGGSC